MFIATISRVGIAKMLLIYIPKSVKDLLSFGDRYKVTLEKVDEKGGGSERVL